MHRQERKNSNTSLNVTINSQKKTKEEGEGNNLQK